MFVLRHYEGMLYRYRTLCKGLLQLGTHSQAWGGKHGNAADCWNLANDSRRAIFGDCVNKHFDLSLAFQATVPKLQNQFAPGKCKSARHNQGIKEEGYIFTHTNTMSDRAHADANVSSLMCLTDIPPQVKLRPGKKCLILIALKAPRN